MKRINLIGQKFGNLEAIEEKGKNRWGNCLFLCKCSCGNQKIIASGSLITGKTKSCGCLSSMHRIKFVNFSHGLCNSSFYNRFMTIKARCNNPKSHNYSIYGARGIQCLWRSFEEFRDDMYGSYLKHIEEFGLKDTSIDRIDVNGNYCKENCRWATCKEQSNNTRKNNKLSLSLLNI